MQIYTHVYMNIWTVDIFIYFMVKFISWCWDTSKNFKQYCKTFVCTLDRIFEIFDKISLFDVEVGRLSLKYVCYLISNCLRLKFKLFNQTLKEFFCNQKLK